MLPTSIPFKFDLSHLLKRAQRQRHRVGDVRISLPFVSIGVNVDDREKRIAREIVIRLRDRRVLSAWECCDDCIDSALASLQEIRQVIVDKQVELSDLQDGPLYLLLDTMLAGIRQFLTYEEALRRDRDAPPHPRFDGHHLPEHRQGYFDGLELLRGHLSRCLGQVAVIADMEAPAEGVTAHYQGPWNDDAYIAPPDTGA
ncbi:MAG: hypothetical protein RLQ73_01730 [Hoeflea sp. D1-CHI-28]